MITTIDDNDGRVIAFCEWRLVGPSGLECPNGEYIWINEIWVHKDFRMTHRVNRIVDEIMRLIPQAKYCYFYRKQKNNKLRIYTRAQFERRRACYDPLITGDK